MAAGVMFFAFVVLLTYLHQAHADPNPSANEGMNALSIINAAIAIFTFAAGNFFANRLFSDGNLARAVTKEFREGNSTDLTEAQKCVMLIRAAFLIRIASLEMPAFIGLAFTMAVIAGGAGSVGPAYLLNAVTALPVLIYVAVNFPTAEKLEEIFKTKIQKSI